METVLRVLFVYLPLLVALRMLDKRELRQRIRMMSGGRVVERGLVGRSLQECKSR